MSAERDDGLLSAAREAGKGALLGALWGVFSLLRPGARGHEGEFVVGYTALGTLVFSIRFLLSDLSEKGTGWYYIVWSFSYTLAALAVLAVTFTKSGYDADILVLTLLLTPFGGAWFGYLYRRATRT